MKHNYSNVMWCCYADDGLAHCRTKEEAEQLLESLRKRFIKCGLQLHPDKTKIVYCKDGQRKGGYQNKSFNFLGYTFRGRKCKNSKRNSIFVSFTPAVSNTSLKEMRSKTRKSGIKNLTNLELKDIAEWYNHILQGWINYYGKYNR